MPSQDHEVRIIPSVLDRMIDEEPAVSREAPASRQKSLRQLKQAVRRDLEWLLNSRQIIDEIPADFHELSNSLAAYGLPDFTSFSVKNPSDQSRIRRVIEEAIGLFEPRLTDVIVSPEPGREAERSFHFRIDARLKVEPSPEPVVFDTTLHFCSGEYTVQSQ